MYPCICLYSLFFVHLKKKNEFTAKAECTAAGKEKTRAKQSCIQKTKTLKNRKHNECIEHFVE